MRGRWLLAVVVLVGLGLDAAWAQRGRSYSSGRSSSGGSSSGRSYSSGSSGRSSSSSGRSYSSGSPSRAPSTPSPAPAPSGGRSYSSGKPSPPSTTSPPGGSWTPKANPGAPSPGMPSAGGGSAKPMGKSYDPAAARAQQEEASRAAYTRSQQPRTTYTTPGGQNQPIRPEDPQVRELRRELDDYKWRTWTTRERTFYAPYWSRPVVVYNDPYNSFFWYWLLDQSLDNQAYWVYHHRLAMDQARYNALLAQNAQLAARVAALEGQHLPRDSTFVPPGLQSRDLMYNGKYNEAVYNPVARPTDWGRVFWTVVKIVLLVGFVIFLVWLVFVKRWGGTAAPRAA